MKFIFAEKKMEASPEIRTYAERKVGKIEKFFKKDTETEAYITFSTERGRDKVEVTLNNNGMFYRASVATGDMFASIDEAADNIERQIRKNKTRLAKRLRDGAFEREVKPLTAAAPAPEEDEFQIVRTKRFSIKPMTPEEAILQMNLLEHEFFVFKNTDDEDSFSVVYRRRDGGYGLISSADA